MISSFQKYITEQNLFSKKDRVLIATSGGIDSSVLCHLFHQSKFDFGIAHCNFQLRGIESDSDENFVRQLAEKFQVSFFSIDFETNKIAKKRKDSIQVVARDLRYIWLEKIRQQNDYQWIATAHHLNDSIETILYNFTKGCGIRGLHGIPSQNGKIIRPLLFASKKAINSFAQKHDITYREDSSNATDKYSRNKIRQHVVPILKELNPAFERTSLANIERMKEAEALYNFAIDQLKKEIIQDVIISKEDSEHEFHEVQYFKMDIQKLLHSPAPQSVLFEILSPYGFNNDQTSQVLKSLEDEDINSIGKQFLAENYELIIDRKYLIIQRKENCKGVKYFIQKGTIDFPFENHLLRINVNQKPPQEFPKNPNLIYLDESKIEYPLVLRHWQKGDFFHPFGMGGKRKKLSDFFTDMKLNRFEKNKVWIVESSNDLCWIVGHRTDDRFKVHADTKSCLVLEFIENHS